MQRYRVPGVAVGVWWQGREHLRGFGVTNVRHPLPRIVGSACDAPGNSR